MRIGKVDDFVSFSGSGTTLPSLTLAEKLNPNLILKRLSTVIVVAFH